LFLKCFVLSFTLLYGLIIPAQSYASSSEINSEYFVELLTEEDGFVSSEIYSIIQDHQGLLWFGTGENGIMRYDGRKVTLFEYDNSKPSGLSHNDAGNLMLDHNGIIWIGTWGGGANSYDPKTGSFQHFINDPQHNDSLASNRIQSLFHDQTGSIWLGSYDSGLSRYLGNNSFERIDKISGEKTSLSHNRIWAIEDNNNDSLWVATSFGLNLFNKHNKTFFNFLPAPDNPTPTGANEIRNILKTSTDQLLVGTQKGPFSFDKHNGLFIALKTQEDEYLGQVNSMIEDKEGHVWFVTNKGLYRRSNINNQIERFVLEHNNGLRIIFQDNSGTLWVTSENHGIYKIVQHRKFKSINNSALMAPNAITVDANGDLLILSASSQLYKWDVSSRKLETLSEPFFSKKNGYDRNSFIEMPILFLDEDNTLWIAQDDGLAQFNLQSKQVDFIRFPKSDENYEEFRELRALNMDQYGKLWIGTYKNGIYRYDPMAKTFSHLDESLGLSHPEVLGIFKDSEQSIWVGTGDGLNLWDDINQQFIVFKSDKSKGSLLGKIVQDVHQSRDGKLWIATQKGLNLYIPETDKFKHYSSDNGIPTSLIRAIEDDKEGNLWLTTNKGISRLNPVSGDVTNFDGYDGLLGLNYYSNSLVRASNETIFTSSQRGIEFFSTANSETINNEFNVVLTGFNKDGRSVTLENPYSYVTDIELSYQDYFFSFEFSVLDYISPRKNQYAYKLEGYDDNWIEIGNRNMVSFTNLDGGSYRFLVKASNSNGKWGDKLLSIELTVSPAPWQTWWAYSLYILVTLLLIFAFIVFRTRLQQTEITRQKQFVLALEVQVAEKTASLNMQARDLLEANKKLELLTYQDGLTGLYNRRYFDKNLTIEIQRHYRQKQPLSLILCDIDHFKLFNDSYGHQQGDYCLKQVAECIRSSIGRITDATCRYGGEEFVIILPDTSVQQSTLVAERLCAAIENMKIPHENSDTSAFVTLTLGVVTIPGGEKTSVDSIVFSADKALYIGKSNGRNRVVRSD
jgi:diguanylate cyclase (GGDEF)-like protein